MVYVEEVFPPKVKLKAIFRNSVTAITSALTPRVMLILPGIGPRLKKAGPHLLLTLRDAAMMDAAMGRPIRLHAAMVGAAVGRLGSRLWGRPAWLLMRSRCGTCLLMLLLLPLLRSSFAFMLCVS